MEFTTCGESSSVKTEGRTLFLSFGVPPYVSAQSTIVINLAQQFSKDEMIVAGEHQPMSGVTFRWNENWPPIFYLFQGWPQTRKGSRLWRRLMLPLLLIRCIRLVRKFRCKNLLVVFPNEVFLLAGYLTSVFTGVKLFPYFHNTYLENRTGSGLLFARWLQGRVFAKAAHVFVMSEGMVELYRERYPELKCSALVHSFNESLPDKLPPEENKTTLEFIISGTIWEVCLDATRRVCEALAQNENINLTFLSGAPPVFLQDMGLLGNGNRHETVPHGDVVSRLRRADIVVLPHGFTGGLPEVEYRTIFPTRTIEYLICGRPILAHAPPDCYLTRFLRKHNCALIVDEPSIPALIQAIERLRSDATLRAKLVRNAFRAATMFHAPRVAVTLRAALQRT